MLKQVSIITTLTSVVMFLACDRPISTNIARIYTSAVYQENANIGLESTFLKEISIFQSLRAIYYLIKIIESPLSYLIRSIETLEIL